jgi:diguanylate cyclase (GGDEF)-like protein
MNNDIYHVLLSDCLLAIVLFGLFWYVAQLSRNLRGIITWGSAHLVYTLGATLLDAIAPALSSSGDATAARIALNAGSLLACAGIVGLAWSIIQFTQQRALSRWEIGLMPFAIGLSLLAWALRGTTEAQGMALSAAEIIALSLMAWHLRDLDQRPDRLPARMMMGGCVALVLLYGSVAPGWLDGRFGIDPIWVSADLSIWFMLNFCMLMLTSFRAAESLRHGALYDLLTGVLNRRGLDAELQAHVDRMPADAGLAAIALDLDHFKSINDRYGHETGDGVLQRFAAIVHACLQDRGLFARLGGEEFVVLLYGDEAALAPVLAERIRERVSNTPFLSSGAQIPVSVSLGVCQGGTLRDSFADLLRTADQALYDAKRGGRDRVALREYVR